MQPNRTMNEVFRIITGALKLDVRKVRNYTAFLADNLEKEGDPDSAARLRKLLEETDHQLRPADLSIARALPVDSESRFPLVERVNLRKIDEPPLILPDTQWAIVQEFLTIAKCHAQLEATGMDSAVSLLVYGPPGCGKNRLARHIAKELGLDLYIARLDGLISSYLGSTSKNIRALFDFGAKTPCVMFLDEFDAIAKLRADSQELGELKRVVNSFIQNLDTIGRESIILAATNHEGLLDSAIWRRFTYRIELSYPAGELRAVMWKQFLEPLTFRAKEIAMLVDLTDGFSGSDIHDACLRLHRRKLTTRQVPTLHDAFQGLQNIAIGNSGTEKFLASLKNQSPNVAAKMLHERNPKLYSLASLGRLFGRSKQTAYRLISKER